MKLYQQMGGHRDELSLHERSLDVLVGLLKEEMVSCVVKFQGVCTYNSEKNLKCICIYLPVIIRDYVSVWVPGAMAVLEIRIRNWPAIF